MKEDILKNLKKSIKNIPYIIYSKEAKYFDLPEVQIQDYEIYDGRLIMVLFNIKFTTYSEPEFSEFISDLITIDDKLKNIFKNFAFSEVGNITKPNQSSVNFSDSMLVDTVNFTFDRDEIQLELGVMYAF